MSRQKSVCIHSLRLRCAAASVVEQLERRRLLTSTLYLDFGDNFPGGTLNTTVLTLRNNFGASGLQGPDLRQPDVGSTAVNEALVDGDNLTLAPTAPQVTFDYNNSGGVDNTDYTALRANVLSLVQRYYTPFDVSVVLAPNLGAANNAAYITGVRTTLQLGANADGERDGWLFLTNMTRTADGVSIGNITSNFGVSAGGDIGGNNAADNVCLAYADQILGAVNAAGSDADTRLAYTAAHEGAHDFGLQHTRRGINSSITAVTTGAAGSASFQVAGNITGDLFVGEQLVVSGSTGNDGTYTIRAGSAFNNGTNRTTVNVNEAVGNATANGIINDGFGQYILSGSDMIVGSASATNRMNFDVFSRFAMRTDSGAPATVINYDRLANGNNLGLNGAAPAYITGTGAFDQITLSNGGGTTVNVAVSAFRNANFTGQIASTYNYNVDSAAGIMIEAGLNADQITLNANLAANVTVRGMNGNDQLVVLGNNLASGSFTPGNASSAGLDDQTYFGGTLVAGSTTINLQEFLIAGSVQVQDIGSFNYITPNGADNMTVATPTAGSWRVTGTSGGANLLPFNFTAVGGFTLDTATNDGAGAPDTVIFQTGGVATGLNTVNVNTGGGADELRVNFTTGNPIPGGGYTYDGGGGADSLRLSGGSFINETYTPTNSNSGTINLDGSVLTYQNLAPITDTVPVANLSFNGSAGADQINVVNGPVVGLVQTTQINSGNGTFELLNFGNKTNVHVNGVAGADVFTMSATLLPDGLATLELNGHSDTNAGDDNAADTMTISTTLPGVPLNATGGGGGDEFTIVGSGVATGSNPNLVGQDGDDVFHATLSPNAPISVNGGPHVSGDTLHVNGEATETTILATTFTRSLFQPVSFTNVELLRLTNGQFGVPGALAPNVQVDQDAKLFGTGTIAGAVSAVANGVISPGITQGSATGILGTGNLSFAATSSYQVQVNGLVNGTEHDVLNVTGTVSLGGASLDLSAGIVAVPGDEFMIIHNDAADSVLGTFAQGSLITVGAQKFAIDYAYDGDGDGKFNDVALIRYGAALAPDPCEPGKQALYVSATTGGDDIRFVSLQGNKTIQVFINNVSEGIFQPTGLLIGFGQSGDDTITVQVPSREGWLFGQVGNDLLTMGNNDGMMLGGVGNDTALAGNAKDILIGGVGADLLKGNNGDDLLIGGSIAFETNTPANRAKLCAIFDEWTRGTGGWKGKADHLTNGGGKNGTVVLNPTTVFDDAAVDNLQGGNGKDWFLARTTGAFADILDAEKNELIQVI